MHEADSTKRLLHVAGVDLEQLQDGGHHIDAADSVRNHFARRMSGQFHNEWNVKLLLIQREPVIEASVFVKFRSVIRCEHKQGFVTDSQLVEFGEEVTKPSIGSIDLFIINGSPESNIFVT